jgi:hypothetical protein
VSSVESRAGTVGALPKPVAEIFPTKYEARRPGRSLVAVQVPSETRRALIERAEADGVRVSDLLRRGIAHVLEEPFTT